MQGILISLATAVILAIGGAFAAPYVVDWNAWRGAFESEMSKALGVPVVIRGPIDAQILPAPRLVLRDVTLGDVVSTGGTVKELQAELSLGELMRGDVVATGVTLVRPQMRLVLDSAGEITLPTGSGEPAEVSIQRLQVENGALDLLDRASDRTLSLSDLDLKGEARSLSGPFRLDGEVAAGTVRFGLRSTLSSLNADNSGRLRLVLTGLTSPFGVDLDGTLGFSGRTPSFTGRAAISRKGTEALQAWQLSGQVRAGPTAVVADKLDLALGGAATPAQLSGSARLSLGRAVGLDAVLNARSLDLDALSRASDANAGDAPASPTAVFARFLSLFSDLPTPQAPSKLGLAVEQLMLGGTLVRDAHADLSGGPDGWRIDVAEAQLPGMASLRLTDVPVRSTKADATAGGAGGAPAQGDLSGALLFTADDPSAFLRWAAPDAAREYVAAVKGPVRLAARFAAAPGRISLKEMEGTFADSQVTGALTAALGAKGAPNLDVDLKLKGFEIDPILAAARQAAAGMGGGADAKLKVTGTDLTFTGLPVRSLAMDGSATGGSWRITRFLLDYQSGIHLEGAGWMENFSTEPRGELNLSVTGDKADGLVPVARLVAGDETAAVMEKLMPVAAPVKLTASSVWSEGGGRQITADGTLGELSGSATFARTSTGVPLSIEIKGRAADATRTLAALGIDGLAPRLGSAAGTLSVAPLTGGQSTVKAQLRLAGLTLQGEGTARLGADGTLFPKLALRLDGADLGKLLPQVAAAVDGPAPAALSVTLSRSGPSWRLDSVSGSLAGAPLTGDLAFAPGAVPRFTGKLAFDALSLPHIVGLFGARAPDADGVPPWSSGRFSARAVNGVAADVELFADRLLFLGPYAFTGAQMRLIADNDALEIRNLDGTFGGGRALARLAVRPDGDQVHADGRLVLDKVDAAALLGPTGGRTPPSGTVSLTLDLGGNGRNLKGLVESLSGQGTLKVEQLKVAAADPSALAAVLAETEGLQNPPDERRTAALFDRALEQGPLVLPVVETTIGVVNGAARLSPARAMAGRTTVTLNGGLELPRLDMEALIDFEGTDVAGSVPAGTVAWRGPVANPARRVGATALTSVIALRAIERETRRLEEHRAGPAGASDGATPVTAPARPAVQAPIQAPIQVPVQAPPVVHAPAAQPQPQAQPSPQAPARPAAPAPVQPQAQPAAPPTPAAPAQVQAPVQTPAPTAVQAPAPAAVRSPAPAPAQTPAARAPASVQAPAATPAPAQGIERQAAPPPQPAPPAAPAARAPSPPPQSFGVGTTAPTGGAATPANRPSASTQAPARPTARSPEAEKPARTTRPAESAARTTHPKPATERRPPVEILPPPAAHLEPVLPPTRGFGDLPRPPGLVGGSP